MKTIWDEELPAVGSLCSTGNEMVKRGDQFSPKISIIFQSTSHLKERTALTVTSSTVTSLHSEEQRQKEENVGPKVLSKSAQSEMSIIKLYKCGGASWNNPETCKFSSENSEDFLLHLYRNHMVTNNNSKYHIHAVLYIEGSSSGDHLRFFY